MHLQHSAFRLHIGQVTCCDLSDMTHIAVGPFDPWLEIFWKLLQQPQAPKADQTTQGSNNGQDECGQPKLSMQ